MHGRREETARLAGLRPEALVEVTVEEARRTMADHLPAAVLALATAEPATYWRVGNGFVWLDDPYFGPPIAMHRLAYDPDLGLCDVGDAAPPPGRRRVPPTEWELRGSRTGE